MSVRRVMLIVIQMQPAQIRLDHIIALANLDSVEMAESIAQVRVGFVPFSVFVCMKFTYYEHGFVH